VVWLGYLSLERGSLAVAEVATGEDPLASAEGWDAMANLLVETAELV